MAVMSWPLLKLLGPEHCVQEIREPEQRQNQTEDLIEHLKTLTGNGVTVEEIKAHHRHQDQNDIEHGFMLRRTRALDKPPNG
jgi:hypothetical protein